MKRTWPGFFILIKLISHLEDMELQKVIDSIMSNADQFVDETGEWQEELIMSHFKLNQRQLKFVLERLVIAGNTL